MLLDWFIYGLLIWGLVAALNASIFQKQPASHTTAWVLTICMFFVNLIALTALQFIRYRLLSQDLGLDIKPKSPVDFLGAFTASWFFFTLLRKVSRHPKTSSEPALSSVVSSAPKHHSPPLQQITQFSAVSVNTPVSTVPMTELQQMSVDEDRIYASIAEELEIGVADKGLWTRLFAECGGDEKQTKVLYIKQRAERLIAVEHARLEQLAKEQAAQAERLEQIKREAEGLADPRLVAAVWDGNWATASKLLREGVKPIGSDENGDSLLCLARKRGDKQMIQLLESHGAV